MRLLEEVGKVNNEENDRDTDNSESEGWPDSISRDFAMARDGTWLKTRFMTFDETVREYKAVEAAFVHRAGDNDFRADSIRRCVAEDILKQAVHDKPQPFDTCTRLWDDLVTHGFPEIESRCTATWFFADCCRKHGQVEIGLAVLEPLIAELERLYAEAAATNQPDEYYRNELNLIRKVHGQLETQRT